MGRLPQPDREEKAIIVVAHTLIVIIWQVLAAGRPYDELGADYFTAAWTPKETRRLIAKLEALGHPSASSQPPDPAQEPGSANAPPGAAACPAGAHSRINLAVRRGPAGPGQHDGSCPAAPCPGGPEPATQGVSGG